MAHLPCAGCSYWSPSWVCPGAAAGQLSQHLKPVSATYHKGIMAHLSHTLPVFCLPPRLCLGPAPSVYTKFQQWLQLQGYLSMLSSGLIQCDGPIRWYLATPVPVMPLLAGLWNRADLRSQVHGQQGWPPPWVPSLLPE